MSRGWFGRLAVAGADGHHGAGGPGDDLLTVRTEQEPRHRPVAARADDEHLRPLLGAEQRGDRRIPEDLGPDRQRRVPGGDRRLGLPEHLVRDALLGRAVLDQGEIDRLPAPGVREP